MATMCGTLTAALQYKANACGYPLGPHAFVLVLGAILLYESRGDRKCAKMCIRDSLWSKRCKDEALRGTVKEVITPVSRSKKWESKPVLDKDGNPMLNAKGKKMCIRDRSAGDTGTP